MFLLGHGRGPRGSSGGSWGVTVGVPRGHQEGPLGHRGGPGGSLGGSPGPYSRVTEGVPGDHQGGVLRGHGGRARGSPRGYPRGHRWGARVSKAGWRNICQGLSRLHLISSHVISSLIHCRWACLTLPGMKSRRPSGSADRRGSESLW